MFTSGSWARGDRSFADRRCRQVNELCHPRSLRVRYTSRVAKSKPVEQLERVVIRFAGDSGDGMQLTGDRFTSETAVFGNDLATFPDFPAEIRAPAGSLPGVSGFQVHFADHDILTPGDQPNVLVAMNPAALKVNVSATSPKGGDDHRQHGRVQRPQPAEGRATSRTRSRTGRSPTSTCTRSRSRR